VEEWSGAGLRASWSWYLNDFPSVHGSHTIDVHGPRLNERGRHAKLDRAIDGLNFHIWPRLDSDIISCADDLCGVRQGPGSSPWVHPCIRFRIVTVLLVKLMVTLDRSVL